MLDFCNYLDIKYQRKEILNYVDITSIWIRYFCRYDSDLIKKWNKKYRLQRSNSTKNHRSTHFFMDDGFYRRLSEYDMGYQREDILIFNLVRFCYRSLLAMLFQSTSIR